MNPKATVYVEAALNELNWQYEVSLESLITIFVYKLCSDSESNTELYIKLLDSLHTKPTFLVDLSEIKHTTAFEIPDVAYYCKWPVVVLGNSVIAGLCSVARQIIKSSGNTEMRKLLGFREACLMSCSESSIWTKFCEVDIISTIKDVILNPKRFFNNNVFVVPFDVMRFESHMTQPVRVHNVYKLAREKSKNKSIISGTPLDQLPMEHIFAEGIFMTLSDIILFLPFKILANIISRTTFTKIQHVNLWFSKMLENEDFNFQFSQISNLNFSFDDCTSIEFPKDVPNESLYSSDPKRYKPQNRIYTKDADVEAALAAIDKLELDIYNNLNVYGSEEQFDWKEIPIEANPEGGALPEKRADRKCGQLESLVKPVLKIVNSNKYRIVDFCSGSGHLGILLAVLLPTCEVVLVENKERSLERAKETIYKIGLQNVKILQSNLDYFKADFDLGVSLHACGVATDLVIQTCIQKKAHFVCCPCCYGGIHNCYHLTYPRSKQFSSLDLKEYLNIAHAADQTHKDNAKTLQGFRCMDIIDTDRKLLAESEGYEVYLGKLQPLDCTPKNNLLVGLFTYKL